MAKKSKSILKGDYPIMTSLISTITLISTLGAGIWALGDRPPWVGQQRFAQMEKANLLTRYSQVLQDIARLSIKRRTPDEERWYQALLIERKILACQLKLEHCG